MIWNNSQARTGRAEAIAASAAARTAITSLPSACSPENPAAIAFCARVCDAVCSRSGTEIAHRLLLTTNKTGNLPTPAKFEVRGRGLFAGIEPDASKIRAKVVTEQLLSAGTLTKNTHRNTIRMAPPFVIEKSEIDWAIDRIEQVLDEVRENIVEPLVAQLTGI